MISVAGGLNRRADGFHIGLEARDGLATDGLEVNHFGGVASRFKETGYLGVARSCVPRTWDKYYCGLDLRHVVD